jgi:hypothetical protein
VPAARAAPEQETPSGARAGNGAQHAQRTPSPANSPEPAIDVEAIRTTLRDAGVEDALDAMLDAFAIDYPTRRKAIMDACDAASAVALRAAAHALKSAAGAIRALPLARVLQSAESHARDGRVGEAVALRDDILAAGDAVMAVLAARRSATPA